MSKKWAISWLIPAVCILLLHTLVPHSHENLWSAANDIEHSCSHKQHGILEFFQHLVTQDVGTEHLEHFQNSIKKQDFNKKVVLEDTASTLFFNINNNTIIDFIDNCNFNKFNEIPNFLISTFFKNSPFRGPPFFNN